MIKDFLFILVTTRKIHLQIIFIDYFYIKKGLINESNNDYLLLRGGFKKKVWNFQHFIGGGGVCHFYTKKIDWAEDRLQVNINSSVLLFVMRET